LKRAEDVRYYNSIQSKIASAEPEKFCWRLWIYKTVYIELERQYFLKFPFYPLFTSDLFESHLRLMKLRLKIRSS
jgi:hypothetical protein